LSVEVFVIAGLVDEGSPKRAFQAGITQDDFEIYDEEFAWIIARAEKRKPITSRLFKRQFPDFDFILPTENLSDLLDELKQERAYLAVSSAIESVYEGDDPLSRENVIQKAETLREVLGDVLRIHAPQADIAVKSEWEPAYERAKQLQILRANGEAPGLPTGLTHFDVHFGGWQPETTYLFLGRPGDAKSFTLAKGITEAAWDGARVGMFSPEMTRAQHECRFHTLLSAKREVQEALNLKGAFRNRQLRDGHGFNLKEYRRFLQWLDENMKGEIHLFTQKYRREKMSLSYIESRIEDYGLDMVCVDPIYKLRAPKARNSRWEELGEIVDRLVDISHTFNIPVIMSNQASRALVGKRGDAPTKDSSFGADSPVQEANCVIGVKHYSDERQMKFRCDKNRDGEQFTFTAKFHPNVGILEDITPISGDHLAGYDPDKAEALREAMGESKMMKEVEATHG
jgi:replicative DNA helicase